MYAFGNSGSPWLPCDSQYRTKSIQCRAQRSPNRGEFSNRSMTASNACGDSSTRNAWTSSGAGGNPVSAKVARRSNVRLSARAAGCNPCSSSLASTNRSTGFSDHAWFFTAGGSTRRTGCKLHHFLRFAKTASHDVACASSSTVGGLSRGSGAPIAIHFSKSEITALLSFGPP